MWFEEAVFYQIYPFGFCGAPEHNDGTAAARLDKIEAWIPHMQRLGVDAVYLCPVFESDTHGYDTRDYTKIDCRLGTNEGFAALCAKLHGAGIRVVPDAVFNHVGRGFWAFQDVIKNRQASPYCGWFSLDFGRDSNYGDGFWYEGWEGHYELVKLNLQNPAVVEYLLECVAGWVKEFDIDGLRLDVAYLLPAEFLQRLRRFTEGLKPEFFLLGEAIHGDYRNLVSGERLHSATNYECFKGIHSSFNDLNLYEIGYSLNRQFGPDHWTVYKGLPLFSFVDNHDVNRLASTLKEKKNLPAAYGLLFGMPGIPCVYYGSEWGAEGVKGQGSDAALRPCFDQPQWNALTDELAWLAGLRHSEKALCHGGYRQMLQTNQQLAFQREHEDEKVLVCINAGDDSYTAPVQGSWKSLRTGAVEKDSVVLPPHAAEFYTAE